MKLVAFTIFLTSLIGCSTVPVEAPQLTGPAIQFVRDSGFVGGGCTFDARINGEVVGRYGLATQSPGKSQKEGIASKSATQPGCVQT